MTTTSPTAAATTHPDRAEFDVCGDLPRGTTVLEASAGTGKTYTIAGLAARYVAEGVAELGELMLVTFGRMASNELRSRVHDRLVDLEARLAEAVAGLPHPRPLDQLEELLLVRDRAELALRHRRVRRALADFDAATIATTHEFSLRMLDGLGVLGDRDPQAVFVEHLRDLVHEVATDEYLRRYARDGYYPMDLAKAIDVGQHAVDAVHARLLPAVDPQDHSTAVQRADFARAVRDEVARRKAYGRLFSYDDMLTRLRDALVDPDHGPAAAERLRQRYRIVLVDEFQDTDPIQWDIIRRAFHGACTLVLIGDPKQAIYAFRGADVYSYLDAVDQADQVLTLGTNWRSDAGLVDALDTLFGGAALGEAQIVVRPVRAQHRGRRLVAPAGDPLAAPIRLRIWPHAPDAERVPGVATIRPRILADLVADITAVLASPDVRLDLGRGPRPVQPADIAVLVRKNERGEAVRDALVAAGVPAVMHGASSVFSSPEARDWLTLLTTLEQPRQQTVRQAALTCFFGWTFTDLATADGDALIELTQRVRAWSRVLAAGGVAALLEAATTDERVPERLLAQVGGERRLTDLRHVAQALHQAMTSGQLGVNALVEWLRERIADARGAQGTEGTRRLETDAQAVTVLTVHRSKGLEFPIVYLPELWDRHVNSTDEDQILALHEDDPSSAVGRGASVLDVGGRGSESRAARFARHQAEESGEDLRLGYVALTRAQCQVVTWWAPSHNTRSSALQRFLYRRVEGDPAPAPAYDLDADPFSGRSLGSIGLEQLTTRSPSVWQPVPEAVTGLEARRFRRTLDLEWRRTSYSALTAAVHGLDPVTAPVGSEPEVTKEDDESVVATPTTRTAAPDVDPGLVAPSPMAELPMGADFGTAVHAVFEAVDPAAPDLADRLRQACATVLSRLPSGPMTVDQLAAGLLPTFSTSLGPLAAGRRLSDIGLRDQLAELSFEFPLAGGDRPNAELHLGQLAPLLRRHLADDDPLVSYPDRIDHPALAEQSLRGYLTGSIDAVLRLTDDSTPRYLVADYKTNWLGSFDGAPLTVGAYTPTRMAEAMMAAHYPLQALLYSVAVHRMLRWRQPGYDPEVHLGGVLYLFIRGMAGPDTPTVAGVPCGVFSWRPPAALVVELSDLLDGVLR